MVRIEGELDPKTPEEYLEGIRRVVKVFSRIWEALPDGNGVNQPSEKNATMTRTGMFLLISGFALSALDYLEVKGKVDK